MPITRRESSLGFEQPFGSTRAVAPGADRTRHHLRSVKLASSLRKASAVGNVLKHVDSGTQYNPNEDIAVYDQTIQLDPIKECALTPKVGSRSRSPILEELFALY